MKTYTIVYNSSSLGETSLAGMIASNLKQDLESYIVYIDLNILKLNTTTESVLQAVKNSVTRSEEVFIVYGQPQYASTHKYIWDMDIAIERLRNEDPNKVTVINLKMLPDLINNTKALWKRFYGDKEMIPWLVDYLGTIDFMTRKREGNNFYYADSFISRYRGITSYQFLDDPIKIWDIAVLRYDLICQFQDALSPSVDALSGILKLETTVEEIHSQAIAVSDNFKALADNILSSKRKE